jgi:hypothetical protein
LSISRTAASNSASALLVARAAAALSNISVVVALSAGGALALGATIGLPLSTTPVTVATTSAMGTGVITAVLAVATSTCMVLGGVALPAVLALGPAAPALPVLVGAGGAWDGPGPCDPELAVLSFARCTLVLNASIFSAVLGG